MTDDPIAAPQVPDLTEAEKEQKPILHEEGKPVLPCPKPETVPPMICHYSWVNYFEMGLRRTVKTALYVGGATVVIAGGATLFGVPLLLALEGGGLIVAGGAVASGAGKMWEEKVKADGGTPPSEAIASWAITLIGVIFKAYLNRKKGGQE